MAKPRSSKSTQSKKFKLPVVVPPSSNRLSKQWQQSLLPYQREIYSKAKGLDQVALYMEQGTGKTHTTLALLERWLAEDTNPILIVAPLTACELIWRPVLDQLGHPYVLTHPEGLAKLESQICKQDWLACVVDEAHQYKNPQSKRSKRLSKLAFIPRKVILTGTPLEKDPLDLWAQFRFLKPELLGAKWTDFKAAYLEKCGFMGYDLRIREDRMRRYLKAIHPYIFEVRRKDVLDVRSKRVIVRVDMSPDQARVYQELDEQLIAEYNEGLITAAMAATKLIKLHQIAGGFVYDDQGETLMLGDAKAQRMLKYLDRKCVIFCRYNSEIEGLHRFLTKRGYPVALLTGSTPREDRPKIVNRFNVSKEQILIAQIRVGGISLNLQSAARAIFYSLPMSRTDFEQARARLLRYGQESFVDFILLLTRDSVDEYVYDLLKSKGRVSDLVFDYFKRKKK